MEDPLRMTKRKLATTGNFTVVKGGPVVSFFCFLFLFSFTNLNNVQFRATAVAFNYIFLWRVNGTRQNVRSFKDLTGQNPVLSGHCPLTSRYFKPWEQYCRRSTEDECEEVSSREVRRESQKSVMARKSSWWQGSLVNARLEDENLSTNGCFWRLTEWKSCPIHTIAGIF